VRYRVTIEVEADSVAEVRASLALRKVLAVEKVAPKAPRGCYWRGAVLWAETKVKGQRFRWSLHTDDPAVAIARRKAKRGQEVARAYYPEVSA
jgi:hypothetical protein